MQQTKQHKTITDKPNTNSGKTDVIITSKKQIDKNKPLTIKQQKFVSEVIKGTPKYKAYTKAGYKASTQMIARSESSKLTTKPNVQQAIDDALKAHGLTPEHAIAELKTIVDQNKEIGAKRLAIRDVLELHGWRKDERASVSITMNNPFFNNHTNSK